MSNQKPFKLKEQCISNAGNLFQPQVYQPGTLPAELLNDKYGHFIDENAIADEDLTLEMQPVTDRSDDGAQMELQAETRDLININTATIDDLIKVERIGNSTATKILQERNNGNFTDVQNLIERMPNLVNIQTVFESKFIFE